MREIIHNSIKLVILVFLLFVLGYVSPKEKEGVAFVYKENETEELQTGSDAPFEIQAKSACVFDMAKDEFIFKKNSDEQLPLASLTKLMTALVSIELLPKTTLVEITKEAILIEGDSDFYIGEMWKLEDLIKVMLISSSNDAAFAIASGFKTNPESNNESEFVELMNSYSNKLKLDRTYFLNSTGLDVSTEIAGAYGSCQDVTKLLKYIFDKYPELLNDTTLESINYKNRAFENTNKLLGKFPVVFGGKTGFSDLAGGNLTVIVDKGLNHPIILTVLGSTFEGRFEDIEILYNKFVK
ncbi:serine hydrolase [Patescibacteria group bacterium]|nr:serine hydrolase [Patescibacteria group bacterium]MBU2632957.1 serine hydrolase [Patescibacteria group bacterium]